MHKCTRSYNGHFPGKCGSASCSIFSTWWTTLSTSDCWYPMMEELRLNYCDALELGCEIKKQSNHISRLLFKHGIFPCSATLRECQMNQMPSRSSQLAPRRTGGDHRDARVLRGWRLPSRTWNHWTSHEWSNWRGSALSTLDNDVYVWRYALIVAHTRNELRNELGLGFSHFEKNIWSSHIYTDTSTGPIK